MNIRTAAEQIKSTIPMSDIAALYGLSPNRAGFIQCPFHAGDHTASLKVYKGNRGWTCFGCHAGGTNIDFVMRMDGISFTDAVQKINDEFRLGLCDNKPISLSAFEKQKSAESEQMKQYSRWREDLLISNEIWQGFLDDHWNLYADAVSKPKQERTADDWWIIAEEEAYQPDEYKQWIENKQKEVITFYGWVAESRKTQH